MNPIILANDVRLLWALFAEVDRISAHLSGNMNLLNKSAKGNKGKKRLFILYYRLG